jgi:hypothetical protein
MHANFDPSGTMESQANEIALREKLALATGVDRLW